MTRSDMAQRFAIETRGISADTIDDEVVIVNLKNGFYYSVTELGAEIWSYVQAQLSVGQMIDRIHERYEADREIVTHWLAGFLAELEAEALIVKSQLARTGDPAAAAAAMEFHVPVPLKPPAFRKYTDLREVVLESASRPNW